MNSNPDREANDKIIGLAFRRSLIIFALLAVFVLGGIALREFLLAEGTPMEATVTAPKIPLVTATAPPVRFTDVTARAGITFSHHTGATGEKLLPETMGSGVAFFDYDNDDDQDLLFINSDHWPDSTAKDQGRVGPTMALYQNDGTGHFIDVTAQTGLARSLYGMGCAVGDYDNDGDADLFITAYGQNHLFRNDGGHFVDVSLSANVQGAHDAWSTSASFVDIDNDGDLDLFVANYVHWTKETDYKVNFQLTGIGRAYGPPSAYEGSHNYLYRNQGDGQFEDVSSSNGIAVTGTSGTGGIGKALAVVPFDIDADGWMDLLIANDTVRNFLFYNTGDGVFEERGALLGLAFDRNGKATGAMGADIAHFRNDNEVGIAIGNFANEMTSLYVTQNGRFPAADEAIVEGIGPPSRRALTFGLFFFDYDLDGRLDLLQANGHLEQDINNVQSSQHYRQAAQLFWNCGSDCRSSFVVQDSSIIGDLSNPLVGRGASYADIDADGDLDVVVTQNGGAPLLLRNDLALQHHWLRVKLIGTQVNRDAIGTQVELRCAEHLQRRVQMPSRSYLSQVESVLTFGLGSAEHACDLAIFWTDGSQQLIKNIVPDTLLHITQAPSHRTTSP